MGRMSMFPDITIGIRCSEGLYELMNGTRLWNEYARRAMTQELIKHHALRIPRHFQMGARVQYGYMQRKLSTELAKERIFKLPKGSDLMKTLKMKQSITQRREISMSGAFGSGTTGGKLQGRLTMMVGHPLRDNKRPGGVTPEQIAIEITRCTAAEARDIMQGYANRLIYQIRQQHGPMRQIRRTPGKHGSIFTSRFTS
jgi:hypothetical protein